MARTNRTQLPMAEEVVGYLNIFAVSRKSGTKKKIAWQQISEGDDLAKIAPKLAGIFTNPDGISVEINWNPVSEEEFEL